MKQKNYLNIFSQVLMDYNILKESSLRYNEMQFKIEIQIRTRSEMGILQSKLFHLKKNAEL
jgi:hypothetical protein